MIRGTIQIQEVFASVYSQKIFTIQLVVKFDQNHRFIQKPFLLNQLIKYLLQE